MSLLDLSKEQKQYLILGVVAAVILTVLIVFGIKVSLSSISEARLELHGLTEKIESAEKAVSNDHRDDAEFRSTIAELKAHLAKIPPDRNYYSWATEIIYNEARMVHFEIDTIDENTIAAPADDPKEQDVVELESYSLRINAHGGYENVKGFLERIASNHPLVRVTGIEISTGAEPDVHNVQLFIEWPFNLGYIADSWKGITAQPPASVSPATQPAKPAATSEPGESDRKKQPVPPPSRPARTEPVASDQSMESDIPVDGEESDRAENSENPPEAMLKQ
jgi:hypothetical protein